MQLCFSQPVPASARYPVRVEGFSCADLEIFDITGRRVAVVKPSMSTEGVFDAYCEGTGNSGSALPGGVYIVSLKDTGIASRCTRL